METYLNKCIKIAVENGWKPQGFGSISFDTPKSIQALIISFGIGNICIDTLFWQALGRGLEWGNRELSMWDIQRITHGKDGHICTKENCLWCTPL